MVGPKRGETEPAKTEKIKSHVVLVTERFISSDGFKIFWLLFIVYMLTIKTIPVADTQSNLLMPWLILRKGTVGFGSLFQNTKDYMYLPHNGNFYSTFPPGTSLLALPFFLPTVLMSRPDLSSFQYIGKIASASLMAFAGVLIYYTARKLWDRRTAWIVLIIFAFATNVFAMASQVLIGFTGSVFCLSAGMFFLTRRKETKYLLLAGLAFGWSALCQPVSLLVLPVFAVYIMRRWKFKDVYAYALGAFPPVVGLLAYNWLCYGSPIKNGEQLNLAFLLTNDWSKAVNVPFSKMWATPIQAGIAGQTFSPSRGIFIFSPILLFAFLGLYMVWRKKEDTIIAYGVLACLPMLLAASLWTDWAAGNSFGYRITLTLVPFLALAIGPAIPLIREKKTLKVVFVVILALSIFVQLVGYISYDGGSWEKTMSLRVNNSSAGTRVFSNPDIWSLKNNQLVWEISHFNLYQPTFWQETVRYPNRAKITDVTKVARDGKADVLLTVETPQLLKLYAAAFVAKGVDEDKRLAYFQGILPRGTSTVRLSPSISKSVGKLEVSGTSTYCAVEDGKQFRRDLGL